MKKLPKESGILLDGTGKPEERKKRKTFISPKFGVSKYTFDVEEIVGKFNEVPRNVEKYTQRWSWQQIIKHNSRF